MKKMLKRINQISNELYYYDSIGNKVFGVHKGIRGNVTNINGDVTNINGNATYIRGDVSYIRGNVSYINGDVDECELTKLTDVKFLVKE